MERKHRSVKPPAAEHEADRAERIFEHIRAHGSRLTAPRQTIIEAMLASSGHLTADRLAEAVQRQFPSVNRSTVYRTMSVLEEMGVIDHVHLGHGRAVYHLADSNHQHLVCESCEAVEEIPLAKLESLVEILERQYGFEVDTKHFAIVGLCRDCRTNRSTT